MKRNILPLLLIFLAAFPLAAESLLTLDLKLLQSLGYDEDAGQWLYSGAGSADLTVKSAGNSNVKGELSLDYYPVDGLPAGYTMVSLDKASVKVRFPSLRITMGKTRIGWGEGIVFNAGDVLYGSLSPAVDLTADEARSDTALLTLVRYSAGRSYAEAIALAPEPEVNLADPSSSVQPGIAAASGGGRIVTELLNTAVEAGYLCKGQSRTEGDATGHRPYLSLHGYGQLDWYGSASLAIPFDEPGWEENVRETVHLSAGTFRQFGLGYDSTISVRLEALLYPWGEWTEQDSAETCGLYLYPELTFGIGENLTVPLMAVISPVDRSGKLTAGADWAVYQGFSFLGYAVGELGRSSATFSTGDFSLMAGMRFKY